MAPITSGSCSNPPFYRGTTRHRKWAQRATPPLLCHRVEESLLAYTAASPPRTHGVPPRGVATPERGRLTHDFRFGYIRPTYAADLQLNLFSSLQHSGSRAETLPLGHSRPLQAILIFVFLTF
ncbi:hypothetical protein AVEN_55925-1 [Araneus ventricosus]|uniref:Uncharacterized protein n=1 Tax=Araneus ventricosus TaxID=182803 RepID=A0A4Y2N033_ARAVE|nr:hypothetical protein AVEN_229219-1 [Araneus ventricosus]GBN32689.1 hypothetical protein AVEN_55925-1 [Araneus ventricosus]